MKAGSVFKGLAVGLLVLLVAAPAVRADWVNAVRKWDQMYPPDSMGTPSSYRRPPGEHWDIMAADDWRCTEPSYLCEIAFDGWDIGTLLGEDPYTWEFRVRIWSDVPASDLDESHPGGDSASGWLWERYFTEADDADPHRIGWTYGGGTSWRINIAQRDWFHQQGTQDDPRIYWISIQGNSTVGYFYWGFRDRDWPTNLDDAALLSGYDDYVLYPGVTLDKDVWYNYGCAPVEEGWSDPMLFDGPLPDGWKSVDMLYALNMIPEPGTLGLLALGALAMIRRRRK